MFAPRAKPKHALCSGITHIFIIIAYIVKSNITVDNSKITEKMNLPKIIVIVGPTASGKTDLAIKLAQFINNQSNQSNDIASRKLRTCDVLNIKGAEIISADSRQIYRGMDIGTAKPPRDFSNPSQIKLANKSRILEKDSQKKISDGFASYISYGVLHRLIDIKNPNQSYTVAEYKKDALRAIRKILKKAPTPARGRGPDRSVGSKLPILVGGTGLYIKAVVDNLEIPEVKPNPTFRKKLEKELNSKGLNYLYEKLIKLDPEAAYIVDPKNPRRIIRALEITLGSGKPFSTQRKTGKKIFNALKIGINLPKEELKERIYKRVDKMIRLGLINETKKLIREYPADSPVFDAIGYRETISYLYGKISLNEAVDLIKQNTWHYAKRQITWFKKDKEIHWIKKVGEAERLLREFI